MTTSYWKRTSQTPSPRYTNRPEQFGKLLSQYRIEDEKIVERFYHYDGESSTSALTDANETVTDTFIYTAYGEEVARTGTTTNPFGYKGAVGYYTNAETNDIYVRTRTYEPALGCWLSADPIGFIDGPNLYRAYFVPNGVDPFGEKSILRPDTDPVILFDLDDFDIDLIGCDSKVWKEVRLSYGFHFVSILPVVFFLQVKGESNDCCHFGMTSYDLRLNSSAGSFYGFGSVQATVDTEQSDAGPCDNCCADGVIECVTYKAHYNAWTASITHSEFFNKAYGEIEIKICANGSSEVIKAEGVYRIGNNYFSMDRKDDGKQTTCPRFSVR